MPKYDDFELDVQKTNTSNNIFHTITSTCTEITNATCPPWNTSIRNC